MSYDFAPLLRSAIGFDRLARLVDDAVSNAPANTSYPPYNIEKAADDVYRVTMALAGFGPDDVEIYLADNQLIIKGSAPRSGRGGEILHRGIATRAFERRFALADHIQVAGAELVNGLLSISIRHVIPEALKPRRIPITSGVAAELTPSPVDAQQNVSVGHAA
ncbi:Hsp20 family protein [Asaia sp. BMEF1]|uniref:Hsp20 family protein n=1 Tax=Asaia sp. BMEF1 TaxID=3155932 RepID=UPI003F675E3A